MVEGSQFTAVWRLASVRLAAAGLARAGPQALARYNAESAFRPNQFEETLVGPSIILRDRLLNPLTRLQRPPEEPR